jgi:hypothetical protein
VLRHIGSGIWVALQRIYVIVAAGASQEDMKKNFGDGAIVGAVATVLGAELAILLVEATDHQPHLLEQRSSAQVKRHEKAH